MLGLSFGLGFGVWVGVLASWLAQPIPSRLGSLSKVWRSRLVLWPAAVFRVWTSKVINSSNQNFARQQRRRQVAILRVVVVIVICACVVVLGRAFAVLNNFRRKPPPAIQRCLPVVYFLLLPVPTAAKLFKQLSWLVFAFALIVLQQWCRQRGKRGEEWWICCGLGNITSINIHVSGRELNMWAARKFAKGIFGSFCIAASFTFMYFGAKHCNIHKLKANTDSIVVLAEMFLYNLNTSYKILYLAKINA